MDEAELRKLQDLARKAVGMEMWNISGVDEAWREFAAYVMHIAVDRANRALTYARENPDFLTE